MVKMDAQPACGGVQPQGCQPMVGAAFTRVRGELVLFRQTTWAKRHDWNWKPARKLRPLKRYTIGIRMNQLELLLQF